MALARRALADAAGVDAHEADAHFDWRREEGVVGDPPRYAFSKLRSRVHGRVDGEVIGTNAARVRAFLQRRAHEADPPHLVVFLLDTDGRASKVLWSVELKPFQARMTREFGWSVVIGRPHPEGEAWLLAMPLDGTERKRAEIARVKLSFDPCVTPERLTSDGARMHDAKRVLGYILGEGRSLSDDSPGAGAIERDQADALAARLAQRPDFHGYDAVGLSAFVGSLRGALAR